MTRHIPKDNGIPQSSAVRPIKLLTSRMKWLIGVLKLCSENLVNIGVPTEQNQFLKGRCMEEHL